MRPRPVRSAAPMPLLLPLLAAWLLAASLLTPAAGRAEESGTPAKGSGTPLRLLATEAAPTFERIDLTLDARQPDYKGAVQIDLRVIQPTTALHFHAEDMTIATMVLRGSGGPVTLAWEVGHRGYVTATAPAPIQPGAYTLAIEFTQKFNTQAVGLYRLDSGGQAYAFTQFESDDARKAFPCWHEPVFKIPFQVTVHVPDAGHLLWADQPEAFAREIAHFLAQEAGAT